LVGTGKRKKGWERSELFCSIKGLKPFEFVTTERMVRKNGEIAMGREKKTEGGAINAHPQPQHKKRGLESRNSKRCEALMGGERKGRKH